MNHPDKVPARWAHRFACAFRGLGHVLFGEASGRVHLMAFLFVVGLGFTLNISGTEWAVVLLASGATIGAEALNTAIEKLADRVSKSREDSIRLVKDTSAGGVLAVSMGAAAAGLWIFGPKLWVLIYP